MTLPLLFALLSLVAVAFADTTVAGVNPVDAANSVYSLTVQAGILGGICIIAGLLFVFFGYRLFRIILFVAGFYVLATIGFIILSYVEPAQGWQNHDTIYLVACIAFGIVGGLLAGFLVKLGLACIGAMGGFLLANFILAWKDGGLISSGWGRSLFLALMVVAGIIIIFIFEKIILIVSTSVIGSYSALFGLDMFIQTGFVESVQSFLGANHTIPPYQSNGKVYGMLAGMVVLAILGIFVQYRTTGHISHDSHMGRKPKN
ncbi:uncharacterized protein BJ171DRAFT_493256 [Polychytrium aggregatum]|uniref:uncharacterized protein n=1 Tax=Polychytrium aggregatum TaxID=110093 RepID=UPI0022FDE66F|nr:uncharacterized protein BJ171DRAFT_493256 [Polychytrium aggregatum]KAI9207623.1 hypothetical protein BJ171DRAFT_493256 [Polychytrium aggregatum]